MDRVKSPKPFKDNLFKKYHINQVIHNFSLSFDWVELDWPHPFFCSADRGWAVDVLIVSVSFTIRQCCKYKDQK